MTNDEILATCILVSAVLFIPPLIFTDSSKPFWEEYWGTFLGLLSLYAIIGAIGGVVWSIFWALKVLGAQG